MSEADRAQPADLPPAPAEDLLAAELPAPRTRWDVGGVEWTRSSRLLAVLVIALVSGGVYLNTLWAGFTWDDQWLILDNYRLTEPSERLAYVRYMLFERQLWRPVKRVSLMLDYARWGPHHPGGFHFTNLLIEVGVCLALYAFVRRLSRNTRLAAATALLFAVHPIHVESIANISHRKEPLSLLFYLLGFLAYLKAWDHTRTRARTGVHGASWLLGGTGLLIAFRAMAAPKFSFGICATMIAWGLYLLLDALRPQPGEPPRFDPATGPQPGSSPLFWSYLGTFLVCYLLGMLSKDVGAVMLPITVILYELTVSPGSWERRRVRLALLLVPSIVVLFLFTAFGYIGSIPRRFTADQILWITGSETSSYGRVFLAAIKAFGTYVRLLVVPWPLYLDRAFPLPSSVFDLEVVFGLAMIALWAIALVAAWRAAPLAALALGWYGLNLLPVLNFIPLTHWLIAERFVYVPSVGFALLVALGLEWLWQGRMRRAEVSLQRDVAVGVLAALVIVHGGLTLWQNTIWKDSEALWSWTIKYNPKSYRGLYGHGLELDNHGHDEEAEKFYRETIKVNPSYPEAHYALALLCLNHGRYEEAIREATLHGDLARKDPEPYIIIGNAYFAMHDYPKAAEAYQTAIDRRPSHTDARFNLANALYGAGEFEHALMVLDESIARRPEANLFHLRGNVLEQLRRGDQAVQSYRRGLDLEPQSLQLINDLAQALLRLNRLDEGAVELERSLAIKRDQPKIQALLEKVQPYLQQQ